MRNLNADGLVSAFLWEKLLENIVTIFAKDFFNYVSTGKELLVSEQLNFA